MYHTFLISLSKSFHLYWENLSSTVRYLIHLTANGLYLLSLSSHERQFKKPKFLLLISMMN